MSQRVLVVDDDDAIRELVRVALDDGGYRVTSVRGAAEALDLASREEPHLALVDIRGVDSGSLIRGLRTLHPGLPILLLTALNPEEVERHMEGLPSGIEVIYKPFDVDDLLHRVEEALGRPIG